MDKFLVWSLNPRHDHGRAHHGSNFHASPCPRKIVSVIPAAAVVAVAVAVVAVVAVAVAVVAVAVAVVAVAVVAVAVAVVAVAVAVAVVAVAVAAVAVFGLPLVFPANPLAIVVIACCAGAV